MWWKRHRLEGLAAASLYEELSGAENAELATACQRDTELAAHVQGMRQFVHALPRTRPPLDRDLVSAVRAGIREPQRLAPFSVRRPMLLATASLAAVLMAAVTWWMRPGPPQVTPAQQLAALSPAQQLIAEARASMAKEAASHALECLTAVVHDYPADPAAGEALYELGGLAFAKRWYDRADDAYTQLRARYPEYLAASPDRERLIADRLDVLAEARKVHYASLYELDVARQGRGAGISKYEEVVTHYPSTLVAETAAREMAQRIAAAELDPNDAGAMLHAMEMARERCTEEVAIAQLTLEIGHLNRDIKRDYAVAAECYRQAAQTPALAQRASEALTALASLR